MVKQKSYLIHSPTLSSTFFQFCHYYPDDSPVETKLKQFNEDIFIALNPDIDNHESEFFVDYGEEIFTELIIEKGILTLFKDLNLNEDCYHQVSELNLLSSSGSTHLILTYP